jgi:hypothetical protein
MIRLLNLLVITMTYHIGLRGQGQGAAKFLPLEGIDKKCYTSDWILKGRSRKNE